MKQLFDGHLYSQIPSCVCCGPRDLESEMKSRRDWFPQFTSGIDSNGTFPHFAKVALTNQLTKLEVLKVYLEGTRHVGDFALLGWMDASSCHLQVLPVFSCFPHCLTFKIKFPVSVFNAIFYQISYRTTIIHIASGGSGSFCIFQGL